MTQSGSRNPSTSFRNNSIVLAYTYPYYRSTRMAFYCCSNSTSDSVSSIIGLDGRSYSSSFSRFRLSHSPRGCVYVYNYGYRNYLRSSEQGIYTCSIPDVRGRMMNVHVGIYRDDYTSK